MTTEASAEDGLYILTVWVFPSVCFLSIVGNIINIRVVVIHGLDKSYNVMLVCLAVADSTCMLSFFISGVFAQAACTHLHDNTSPFFHLYKLLQILDYGGAWTSFLMILFITSERILAVWFPLTYYQRFTTRKTSVAIVALYISVFFTIIYMTVTTYDMNYLEKCGRSANQTNTCIIDIAVFRNGIDRIPFLSKYVYHIVYGPIPVSLVLLGCVIIVVKIIIDYKKRALMISRRTKTKDLRMTLTLLAVCLLYAACSISLNLIHAGQSEHLNCTTQEIMADVCNSKEAVMAEVANIVALVNCSANPVIYVLLNPRFRKTIVKIFSHDFLRREWRYSVSRGSLTSPAVFERTSVRASKNPSVFVSKQGSPSSQSASVIEPSSPASINIQNVVNMEESKSVTNSVKSVTNSGERVK